MFKIIVATLAKEELYLRKEMLLRSENGDEVRINTATKPSMMDLFASTRSKDGEVEVLVER